MQVRLHHSGTLSDYSQKKYGQRINKNPPRPKYEKIRALPKNKSDFGFYPTPEPVIQELLRLAKIEPHQSGLAPSAGHGAILDKINSKNVTCGELQESNKAILESKGYTVTFADFLKYTDKTFDRITMNPPFWNQADIQHVLHAYSLLNRGGRIVSVMSNGITFRDNQKSIQFRELLKNNGLIKDLPKNSFKESGTNVNTVLIVIDKPEIVHD